MASGWEAHAKGFVDATGGDTAFVFCPSSGAVWGQYTRTGCTPVATQGSLKDYLPDKMQPGQFPAGHTIDGKTYIVIRKQDDLVSFKKNQTSAIAGPCPKLQAGIFVYSSTKKPEELAPGFAKMNETYANQ